MVPAIFSHTASLRNALDAAWLRDEVINNNIANNETPNFKASTVEFETLLKQKTEGSAELMKTTRSKHLGVSDGYIKPRVVTNWEQTTRFDGNNVDIEQEQTQKAKNALYYYTLTQKLNNEYSRLRYVAGDGK